MNKNLGTQPCLMGHASFKGQRPGKIPPPIEPLYSGDVGPNRCVTHSQARHGAQLRPIVFTSSPGRHHAGHKGGCVTSAALVTGMWERALTHRIHTGPQVRSVPAWCSAGYGLASDHGRETSQLRLEEAVPLTWSPNPDASREVRRCSGRSSRVPVSFVFSLFEFFRTPSLHPHPKGSKQICIFGAVIFASSLSKLSSLSQCCITRSYSGRRVTLRWKRGPKWSSSCP